MVVRRVVAQREPEMIVLGKEETFRHDADHCVWDTTDPYRLTQNLWITTEARFPQVSSDNDHVRRARHFVRRGECASQERRRPKDVEGRGCDLYTTDWLRAAVFGMHVPQLGS